MVSKEVAQRSQAKQAASNKQAKDKQDKQIAGAKSNIGANRGYNSTQTGSQVGAGGNSNLTDSQGREYNSVVSQGLRTGILTVAEADGIMRANRGEGFRSNSSGGSYGNPNADYGQRNQRNTPQSKSNLAASQSDLAQARKELAAASTPEEIAKQEARVASWGTLNNLPRDQRIALGVDSEYNNPKWRAETKVAALEGKVGLYEATNRYVPIANPIPSKQGRRISEDKPVAQGGSYIGYSPTGKPIQGPVKVEQSYIGYSPEGKAIQGAPSPFIIVPSIGGATQRVDTTNTNYTVDGKVFATEKEANDYIKRENDKLPLTTIPFAGGLYKMVDESAKYNEKRALANPNDWEAQIMAGGIGIQSGLLNMAQTGASLLESKLKSKSQYISVPPTPTRQVTTPLTFETAGMERSFEGVDSLGSAAKRLDLINNPDNVIARYSGGAQEQWAKQTTAQNYGQVFALAPLVAVDIVTAYQGGLGLLRQGGTMGAKIASKVVLKNTLKNSKTLAIENAPASVWTSRPVGIGQTVTQDGRVYNNVVPNQFGKTGRIEYGISQGIEKIRNIKNPIQTPYLISNTAKTIGADLKYVKSVIKEKIPKVTIPKTPQGIKDVGIKIKLAGEDLSTKSAILQRQAKYKITSQFDRDSQLGIMAEKTQVGIRPIVKGIGVVKSKVQLGVKSLQDKSSLAKRQSVLKYSRFRFEDSIIRPTLMEGSGSGFPNLYKPFKTPQSLLTAKSKVGLGIQKIKTTGDTIKYKTKLGVQRVGTGIKTPILAAKYKTQLGIKLAGRQINRPLLDVKAFGSMLNRQDKLLGRQLGLTAKRAGDKITTKVRTEIKSTKEGMFGILPEEYTFKPKFIVESAKPQALRNRFRTGPQTNIDFGKQGASKGQLGRGQLNNIVGDVKRKIGINPLKNFNIPTQKYPKNNIIGPKQPVELSPKTLGNPRKDPMIGTAKTKFIGPRNIVNEAPRSFIGGIKLKFKPNAVEQLKQSEKIRKADRFKLGYKDEPTELQGKIRDIKSITGQTKQKTSAEKFDGIGIDKSKPINPKQGAFGKTGLLRGVMNKGMLDEIIKTTAKPKLGIATDVKRIAKRTESGIDKQALKKRRAEQKDLTSERTPSSTGGDVVSSKSKNQSLAPLIQKPEPLKLKKKLPGTPITESKTNGNIDWTGTEKTGTLILPPIIKVDKKRKPVKAREAPSFSSYGYVTESVIVAKGATRSSVSITPRTGVKISQVQPQKISQVQPQKISQVSVPKLSQAQPQKIAQVQRVRQSSPSPMKPKLNTMEASAFKQPSRLTEKLIKVPIIPKTPRRILTPLPPVILNSEKFKPKKKKGKQNDFLGNTKLDSIEGLFRRSTIIHGDKRISKQVRKDKRAKFKERGVSFFSKR
jgi:hypothetical protein